jgi:hypothetical protein
VTLADFLKVVKLETKLMAGVGLSTAFNGISCMIVSTASLGPNLIFKI